MIPAGAIAAAVTAGALLLARAPRSPLLPGRLRGAAPGWALGGLALLFALLSVRLSQVAGAGTGTVPLAITELLAAVSLLVLLAPRWPALARGLALAAALLALAAGLVSLLAAGGRAV